MTGLRDGTGAGPGADHIAARDQADAAVAAVLMKNRGMTEDEAVAEVVRMRSAAPNRPVTNYRLFVSEDGKTFVRFWADDKTVEVATRENSWETWGPPVRCIEEGHGY